MWQFANLDVYKRQVQLFVLHINSRLVSSGYVIQCDRDVYKRQGIYES